MRKLLALLVGSLISLSAYASAERVGLFDQIQNNTSGSALNVPASGTTILSDQNTISVTGKTMSGSSNTFTNIPGSALSSGATVTNLGYTPLDAAGSVTATGNLNMGSHAITNLSSTPQANGAAVLDGSAKVLVSELPSTVMEYEGAWNASTNTPTLANTGCVTATNGNVYRVSVAGTQNLGAGNITFQVGDFIICSSSLGQWQDSPAADGVTSVNGMQGAVTITPSNIGAAASGANSDITSLSGLTTPLAVSEGGTGGSTFTTNGILYGAGTSALAITAAGTQYQVLQAGSGGVPAFGAVNLGQSAAVTGTLPVGNGGTGASTLTLHNVILGNGTSPVAFVAPGSSGNILTSNGTTWVSSAPSVTSPSINGGSGATQAVDAGTGISLSSIGYSNYVWVVGDGGPVVVTATPSITACTSDGQELVVIGTDNTDTVELQDQSNLAGSGLSLNGDWVGAKDSTITMHCDVTQGLWVEDSRR